MFEETDPVKSKGDEQHLERRRTELYLLSCGAWRSFKLSCIDFCSWTISHSILYDEFCQMVKDAIFERGTEGLSEVRKIKRVQELFEEGKYFDGCKILKVI